MKRERQKEIERRRCNIYIHKCIEYINIKTGGIFYVQCFLIFSKLYNNLLLGTVWQDIFHSSQLCTYITQDGMTSQATLPIRSCNSDFLCQEALHISPIELVQRQDYQLLSHRLKKIYYLPYKLKTNCFCTIFMMYK